VPAAGCEIDHLVVAAHSLVQGAAWCEATLGVLPGPGGRHVFMGTHNRLLAIGSVAYARACLEIIAIDPDGPAPARPRWFGLDDPALQQSLQHTPRLLHAVVRTLDITRLRGGLLALGLDPGEALAAIRPRPWRRRPRPWSRLSWAACRALSGICCNCVARRWWRPVRRCGSHSTPPVGRSRCPRTPPPSRGTEYRNRLGMIKR